MTRLSPDRRRAPLVERVLGNDPAVIELVDAYYGVFVPSPPTDDYVVAGYVLDGYTSSTAIAAPSVYIASGYVATGYVDV